MDVYVDSLVCIPYGVRKLFFLLLMFENLFMGGKGEVAKWCEFFWRLFTLF